jgi:phage tail sheath protein FI
MNYIRSFPIIPTWGFRTLRGVDKLRLRVEVRAGPAASRLHRGVSLPWDAAGPIRTERQALWAQIRLYLGAFMPNPLRPVSRARRRPTRTPSAATGAMTQDDVGRGIVNVLVGFVPLKPAEFVILKIEQIVVQVQA